MIFQGILLGALALVGGVNANVKSSLAKRHGLNERATQPNGVLTDFEVYQPVLTPTGTSNQYGCIYTQTLMQYTFANSYGHPFVGSYTPPPCSFNRVVMNFTVTSAGRQFDRLAIMYLGDNEVWRTSTAEPTKNGIIWTYLKEMQQYNALWRQPQKIIFDLGNIVDSTYTGPYVTTLTATFFTVPDSPATADQILPISAMLSASDEASVFSIPNEQAIVSQVLPKNVERAVVSLSANGQINEEFWYTNTFNSLAQTFAESTGPLLGNGTWREVQLFIDGQLAGVAWPFPVIFTGGIVPGFWRPIVGIQTFDLQESEIDITPFLPVLLDGKSHTFEIKVASMNDDGHGHASVYELPGSFWLVTGKIFLFLGPKNSITTGSKPQISTPPPQFQISYHVGQNATGTNETLSYSTKAQRQLSISSTIRTSSGQKKVSWTQDLSYSNQNLLTQQGLVQNTIQSTQGHDAASHVGYLKSYSYPINVTVSFAETATYLSLNGTITHGEDITTFGPAVFPSGVQNFNTSKIPFTISTGGGKTAPEQHLVALPPNTADSSSSFQGSHLSTTQSGTAQFFESANLSYSFGTTSQDFVFGGFTSSDGGSVELYSRSVEASNTSIVYDKVFFAGQSFAAAPVTVGPENDVAEVRSPRTIHRW